MSAGPSFQCLLELAEGVGAHWTFLSDPDALFRKIWTLPNTPIPSITR
jgi:hypothetical protein